MRVAVAVSPPLLAELLRRLIDRAGMEVADVGTSPVDVAVVFGDDAEDLDADVTIVLDESARRAAIVDRKGHTATTMIGGPAELIDLVRAVTGPRGSGQG